MIIKRPPLFLSLLTSGWYSFLKTNFHFPIRGRDLRPPVSLGRLFCASSRPLSCTLETLFFGPREGGAHTFFYSPSLLHIRPTRRTTWQRPSSARNGFTYANNMQRSLARSLIHALLCSSRNGNRLVMYASKSGKIDLPGLIVSRE